MNSTEGVAVTEGKKDSRRAWSGVLLATVCFLSFLFGLGGVALTQPNEGLYGEVAREMLERGDFIVPRLNGLVYFEKPPLLYWLEAAFMSVLGTGALAARLPSALSGVLTTALIYWLGQRLWGRRGALYSALVAATSIGYVLMARQVMFDTLFTACLTLSIAGFWLAGADQKNAPQPKLVYLGYAGLALAVLAKGFVGFLPLVVLGGAALLSGESRRWRVLASPGGFALFLLLVVPWHLAIALRRPEWTWYYFVNEHLYRLLGKREPHDFHADPFYSAFIGVITLVLPWSAFGPAALCQSAAQLFGPRRAPQPRRADLWFLHLWFWLPVLLFTVSQSRTLYYVLPSVPPLALLIGGLWDALPEVWIRRTIRRWTLGALILLSGVGTVVWLVVGRDAWIEGMKAGRLLLVLADISIMLPACAVALWMLVRQRFATAFGALTTALLLANMTLLFGAQRLQLWPEEDKLAQAAASMPAPPGLMVMTQKRLERHSSFVFYLPRRLRPVRGIGGRWGGDLQFGGFFPEACGLFPHPEEVPGLAARHPILCLTTDPPVFPLPPGFTAIARQGDSILWANYPANPTVNATTQRDSGGRHSATP